MIKASRPKPIARCIAVRFAPALLSVALAGCDLLVSTQARIQRATDELARGEYRAALIDIRNATASDAKNASAWLLETEISLRLGDWTSAQQALSGAIEAGAPAERYGILSARLDLALGKPQQLLQDIDSRSLRLREPDRSVYRGRAFAALRRYTEAEAAYHTALSIDPLSIDAQLGLAEVYIARNQLDAALSLVEGTRARRPSLAAPWRLRGTILGKQGRFGAMESALSIAWRLRTGQLSVPEQVEVLAELIDAQLALGETAAATAGLDRLEKLAPNALITQLQAGRVALARRDYSTAIAPLTSVVNARPELTAARFMLGSALLAEGQLGQAEHELAIVVQQAPENIEAREQLARAQLALGMPNDAITALSPLAQFPTGTDSARIAILLGIAQIQAGQTAAAIAQLERSSAAEPGNYRLELLLAELYQSQHRPQQAAALIEHALRTADGKPDALSTAGVLYMRGGQLDRALAVYQAAVDAEPQNPEYRLELARAHLALNQSQAAADDAEAVLKLNPDSPRALRLLALIDVSAGRGTSALARVESAANRHPTDGRLAILEGDVRLAMRQYSKADAAYARASNARASAEAAIKSYWARLLGHLPDAVQPLENWLILRPDDFAVRRLLAEAYLKSGRDSDARRTYELIVASNPRDVVALNNLAWLYQRAGDRRAVDTARQAYDLAASNPAVADTYGWVLCEAGNVSQGLKVLESAAKEGGNGDIRFHLASALARAGERDRARTELQELLRSNPPGFSQRAEAERLLDRL